MDINISNTIMYDILKERLNTDFTQPGEVRDKENTEEKLEKLVTDIFKVPSKAYQAGVFQNYVQYLIHFPQYRFTLMVFLQTNDSYVVSSCQKLHTFYGELQPETIVSGITQGAPWELTFETDTFRYVNTQYSARKAVQSKLVHDVHFATDFDDLFPDSMTIDTIHDNPDDPEYMVIFVGDIICLLAKTINYGTGISIIAELAGCNNLNRDNVFFFEKEGGKFLAAWAYRQGQYHAESSYCIMEPSTMHPMSGDTDLMYLFQNPVKDCQVKMTSDARYLAIHRKSWYLNHNRNFIVDNHNRNFIVDLDECIGVLRERDPKKYYCMIEHNKVFTVQCHDHWDDKDTNCAHTSMPIFVVDKDGNKIKTWDRISSELFVRVRLKKDLHIDYPLEEYHQIYNKNGREDVDDSDEYIKEYLGKIFENKNIAFYDIVRIGLGAEYKYTDEHELEFIVAPDVKEGLQQILDSETPPVITEHDEKFEWLKDVVWPIALESIIGDRLMTNTMGPTVDGIIQISKDDIYGDFYEECCRGYAFDVNGICFEVLEKCDRDTKKETLVVTIKK